MTTRSKTTIKELADLRFRVCEISEFRDYEVGDIGDQRFVKFEICEVGDSSF